MHYRLILSNLIFLLSLCISCGNITRNIGFGPPEREIKELFRNAESTYNGLLEGRLESSQQNWNYAIRQFSEIVNSYPESQFADDAQYNIGLCYVWAHGIWKDSPQKAIEAFEYLIKQYPASEFIDDAHYWKAYAYSLKEDYKRAIEEYEKFGAKYPQSDLYKESLYQIQAFEKGLSERGTGGEVPRNELRAKLNKEKKGEIPIAKETKKEEVKPTDVPEKVEPPSLVAPIEEKSGYSHIKDIRFHSWQEFTRVVLDLSKPVKYEVNRLENPSRIYLDIQTATIAPAKQTITINDRLVKSIRASQFDKNTVRVVLDVKEIKRYDIFYLKNPDRLVIDVYGSNDVSSSAPKSPEPALPDQQSPTLVKQLGLKVKTIVIDPGHGGKDPGTIAESGLQEKNVVLDIAKRLKRLLENSGSYDVHLTREDDVFIPLEERTEFANQKGADIFISVHVNSCKNQNIRGIETYYLSLASDEEARLTAVLENASAEKGIRDLASLLSRVLRITKVHESRNLAQITQSRLCWRTGANNRGVRCAPFIVLIGANAPSILIELGFMSNEHDEQLLNSEEYKDKLAMALMDAIGGYIRAITQTG